jgi:hypothetical protein
VAGFRVPLLVVSAYLPKKGYISGPCVPNTDGINNNEVCLNNKPPYWHDVGSILNFTEYVMGLPLGGISQTGQQNWFYDDYWTPDYYGNPKAKCSQQVCPYGLSDFFDFNQSPNPFTYITPITYQPSDFVNLSAFGGPSNTQDPDLETELPLNKCWAKSGPAPVISYGVISYTTPYSWLPPENVVPYRLTPLSKVSPELG